MWKGTTTHLLTDEYLRSRKIELSMLQGEEAVYFLDRLRWIRTDMPFEVQFRLDDLIAGILDALGEAEGDLDYED